jgi:hypothetical protein
MEKLGRFRETGKDAIESRKAVRIFKAMVAKVSWSEIGGQVAWQIMAVDHEFKAAHKQHEGMTWACATARAKTP